MRLHDIPKNESMFRTPEGYFDALPQKVARKARKPQTEKVSLWKSLRLAYAVPAMVVVLAVAMGIYYLQPADNQIQSLVSVEELLMENDISETELLDYYMTYADENKTLTIDELLHDISEEEVEQIMR